MAVDRTLSEVISKTCGRRASTRRRLISCGAALGVVLIVSVAPVGSRAAEDPDSPQTLGDTLKLKIENDSKNAGEAAKLSAEIDKLNFENGSLGRWVVPVIIPALISLLGVGVSVILAWLTIRNERRKTLEQIRAEVDQATHEKRLECYAELTKAMAPLALFFPENKLDRFRCLEIGNAMSRWYFGTGGLLLSEAAKEEYFRLARALTKAFHSDAILAPAWERYAESISDTEMDKYRKKLHICLKTEWSKETKDRVESWEFGKVRTEIETLPTSDKEITTRTNALAFKDYVLLQTLSSRLRTALATDIAGRRRPLVESTGSNRTRDQNAASSNAESTERPHEPS